MAETRPEATRDEDATTRIVVDPAICMGQPVFRGTRINVSVVLRLLGAGATVEDIVADYPDLSTADVQAAIRYAAWLASERTVPPSRAS